ncbi:MAG: ABC transporter substrate-binding protein [Alphaproteobacteria bacterium]|nr:ABC transporter substrate-binding protein [Alphaproteobacteria bacterium]
MRNTLRAAATAAALLLASTAHAQLLEIGFDQSPAGLDPHIATAFSTFAIINGTIYEGLTRVDKDLRLAPSLAESWTISPDGKTYRFKLRGGVKFHNGASMEAADVVATFDRVMSKDIGSPLASRFTAIDKASVVDAATVELTLKEPSAPLLTSLATLAIVPRTMQADKESLQKQPVGTGPFSFAEWQPNSFIRLAKHAGYWEAGLPKLDGLKFNLVPESATRQVGLSSGTYSLLPNIDAATALQLQGKPNVRIVETLELAYTLVGFNTSKPPFNDPRVREAVNYALNRAEIVAAAQFGKGVPGGPLSPALKDWATDTKEFACYAHNPAKARELLKAAGVAEPVAITMNVLPRQDIKDVAQVVQAQLNNAGFKVELKNQELGQFIQDWRNSNFDMFASTNAGSPDPDDYFFRTFRTGGSTNVFKYSNPKVDDLLDKARATNDAAQRKAMYAEVQKTLACDGPIAHLTYGQLFSALRTNVQGYEIMANRSLSYLREASQAK